MQGISTAVDTSDLLSILAIDGSTLLGLPQINTIANLETEAYSIAKEKFCIPERSSKKVLVAELYDYIIGT